MVTSGSSGRGRWPRPASHSRLHSPAGSETDLRATEKGPQFKTNTATVRSSPLTCLLSPTWEGLRIQPSQTESLQQLLLRWPTGGIQERWQGIGQREHGQEDIVVSSAGDGSVQPGSKVCVPIGQVPHSGVNSLRGCQTQEKDADQWERDSESHGHSALCWSRQGHKLRLSHC